MAFINNTPMTVGGSTPTPSGKNYKLKMKTIGCSVTRSGAATLTITPDTNTEFTNFYNWLREFLLSPRPFSLLMQQSTGGTKIYGMHPSYPNGKFDKDSPIQLSFSSGRSYDLATNQTSQIHIVNAVVNVNANAITVSNETIYVEQTEIDSKNNFTIYRKTLSTNGDDLHFGLGIPTIEEESEE